MKADFPIDIVDRLRAVFHRDRSVELMNREAANEIEGLRAELDQARRMYCKAEAVLERLSVEEMYQQAKRRGWDCFKENTNGT